MKHSQYADFGKTATKNAYIVTDALKGIETPVLDEPLDMYRWICTTERRAL